MKRGFGIALLALLPLAALQSDDLAGTWELIEDRGTPVDPWRSLTIDVRIDGEETTLIRSWSGSGGVRGTDSMRVTPDGSFRQIPLDFWLDNRHLGVRVDPNTPREVSAQWKDADRTLAVEQRMSVITSQGPTPLRIYTEYRSSPGGENLEVVELRSTRARPIAYTFRRASDES